MEGNLSAAGMIPGGSSSYGAHELQGSTPVDFLQHHHWHGVQHPNHPSMIQSPICDVFPPSMGQQIQLNPMAEANFNMARAKTSVSEEDEPVSYNEETLDPQIEPRKEENSALWHRVKWTGSMVKLLITALSYIDEDEAGPLGRKRSMNLQKKGKWKTISKVMTERGFCVSPQQCEDKFNDLNKRYKKLNDILGRGTSCQVVENPMLLDMMGHLPNKAKDEVRKILSSKHLFYEEMCSYHNLNRLHLPHDPALQRSLQLALRARDDVDEDIDDDDHDDGGMRQEQVEDSGKRMRQGCGSGKMNIETQMKMRLVEVEKQKMKVEMEMVELENQRLKWERFNRKKDWKLEKMKMENERMRLQNEQMAMELKSIEMRKDM